jgi:MerR family transcriptional regulator, Zn(II)-responsive regulator of zntA
MSYQVSELALKCHVSKDTVRYYAKIGLLQPQRNQKNGYQYFNEQDMKRLDFIRRAKYLGYTLKEIKHIFKESQKGSSPCPLVRDLIQQRLKSNKERLAQLIELQHHMEEALKKWREMPDGVPDGNSICKLIESIDSSSGYDTTAYKDAGGYYED